MSDTPRTDAVAATDGVGYFLAQLSRELERENAALRKVLPLAQDSLRKAMQGTLMFDEAMESFKAIDAAMEKK